MPFHQYSRLFTSGLLSEPSYPLKPSIPPHRARRSPSAQPTDTEPPKPVDSRTYSFLELADPLTSPVNGNDLPYPCCPPERRNASYVLCPRGSILSPIILTTLRSILSSVTTGPVPICKSALEPGPIVCSPTIDPPPRLSFVSFSAGQSFFITEPPLPDSPTLTRRPSRGTIASEATSVSIKSDKKRMNRLAALACLEGRGGPCCARTSGRSHSNFMSMSDDEDEDEVPTPSRRPSTDPGTAGRLSAAVVGSVSILGIVPGDEVEYQLSEIFVAQSPQQPRSAPVNNRHRSRTMESWFPPLSNFIDLRNEEDAPPWRSFIEFSTTTA